mmetsp:Transcript_20563/g.30640  ORF Transcript_20563/g.30640 Transcript_20563/m.30640 type:complete len:92 (+) Transcript_20563:42-317(+)
MKVKVHVREKTFVVTCGDGEQKAEWLAHVGIVRYDDKTKINVGAPLGLRSEAGDAVPLQARIRDLFGADSEVWVVLKEDVTENLGATLPES